MQDEMNKVEIDFKKFLNQEILDEVLEVDILKEEDTKKIRRLCQPLRFHCNQQQQKPKHLSNSNQL